MQTRLEGRAGGILIETLAAPLVLIPLSPGGRHGDGTQRFALIDETDYARVKDFKWFAFWNPTAHGFYARTTIGCYSAKRTFSLHRQIAGLTKQDTAKVDHRNGTGLDNRRSNLRFASQSQNGFNRTKQRNNTSGYKGVVRRGRYWTAEIKAGERRTRLGRFDTPEAAALAYDSAARRLHGEFARTNV